MQTLTATITMPLESFEAYAVSRGYQDFIYDPNDETQTIPNPKTKVQYAQEVFVENAINDFIKEAENAIRLSQNSNTQQLIEAKREELRAAITVS